MKDQDLPALFLAADDASNQAQRRLLNLHKWNTILLVCAATAALISPVTPLVATASVILFLASLGVYIYGQREDFQAKWYQARALAESVRTATWRLVMKAEPFAADAEEPNLEKYRNLLTELLQANTGIGAFLAGRWAHANQVTPGMLNSLRESFDKKKRRYLADRIVDQMDWYTAKSDYNKSSSRRYFALLCITYAAAIILLLARIAFPNASYLPVEVFAVVASSIIGWKQIRRFDELASAYGLTAHELGIIKSRYSAVTTAAQLGQFVADAENAFSREHTQWAARRDH